MAEYFFDLSPDDQREALEYAREQSGRPVHLLEKDIWVVWTLHALFASQLAADLTFKGGTSLSKAYKIIDRFSEDIDLTYDIRKLIPDRVGEGEGLPPPRRTRRDQPSWPRLWQKTDSLTYRHSPPRRRLPTEGSSKDRPFAPSKRGSGSSGRMGSLGSRRC